MKENFVKKLKQTFENISIKLTDQQADDFYTYLTLLKTWNEKFNLTTIVDDEDVVKKHFLDSVYPHDLFCDTDRVVDIGAGAGFPSIPLKILKPNIDFTIIDSVNKKVSFLNEVIDKLKLKNIAALHTRIEDMAKTKRFRESFDFCVSRALAPLPTLLEYSLPLLKVGGKALCYKSLGLTEELAASNNALNILGGEVEQIITYEKTDQNTRYLLVVKKIKSTSPIYPRDKNKPRLQPL